MRMMIAWGKHMRATLTMAMAMAIAIACLGIFAAGCGGAGTADQADDAGLHSVVITHPVQPPLPPATSCEVAVGQAPAGGAAHVALCSPLGFDTRPPSHGDHYPIWADFKSYDAPVPWGHLVHDLEHGAVVIAYRCDAACPDLVAALTGLIADRPADPLCTGTRARNRMILVPDPTLDVPLAAVAWGHVYRSSCLDRPSLGAFIDAHYGHAPEDLCAGGADGSQGAGWCP